jgi:hypothetical protein
VVREEIHRQGQYQFLIPFPESCLHRFGDNKVVSLFDNTEAVFFEKHLIHFFCPLRRFSKRFVFAVKGLIVLKIAVFEASAMKLKDTVQID